MSEYANALGLLALTIGANFTGDLFGCGFKKELTNDPLAKHGMAYLLLLFFVVLTNKDQFMKGVADNQWVTFELLFKALLMYGGFIAFTKCTYGISILVLLILLFIMFMNIEESNKSEETRANISQYKYYATVIAVVAVTYGLFSNMSKQYNDHYEDFSLYKFFLGTTKCDWQK